MFKRKLAANLYVYIYIYIIWRWNALVEKA